MPAKEDNRQLESATLKVVGTAIALLLLIWLIFELRALVINLLLAVTLASAIAPLAEWAEQKKVPRLVTVLCVFAAVAITYLALAASLAPVLWQQALQLYDRIPDYMAGAMEWYNQLLTLSGQKPETLTMSMADIRTMLGRLIKQTLDITAGLMGLILNGILVLFLTAYFVVEANDIWPKLLKWLPESRRARFGALIRPLGARMGGYVRGQLLVSLAVATFLGVGLSVLGVHYSLVLGVLAGLMNLMPFVGSMVTASFAIVIACNQSLLLGGLTLGLFALEQWFESNVIVPQLLGKQVELHPVLVLFAILIGATLMGVPGALVAVPVASGAIFLADEFYLKPLNSSVPESE